MSNDAAGENQDRQAPTTPHNRLGRRSFLKSAGAVGLGAFGASAVGGMAPLSAVAQTSGPSDPAVLNFALNLEYLEAEFYLRAVTGEGLDAALTGGRGPQGSVTGGRQVPFQTRAIRQYAEEIARDELEHVRFLRGALGSAAVAEPSINVGDSFTAVARAAGIVGPNDTFDAYAGELNFLLAAFIFEDVGVTAYKGAAPLLNNKTFLEAAAGLLAVEAYHASNIRTTLFAKGVDMESVIVQVNRIAAARSDLGNGKDEGIRFSDERGNIVPTDNNAIAFSRTAGEVLNIVYLNPNRATSGGFFPAGVNGPINASSSTGRAPTTPAPAGSAPDNQSGLGGLLDNLFGG